MEISRLIFITLLITCSVVTGHSDCEEETISKLPDDQCLSDLDKSELVITTASDETRNLDFFESETTPTSILDKLLGSTTNINNHVTEEYNVDHPVQYGVRKTDITDKISNTFKNTSPLHEEISTHPITEPLSSSDLNPSSEVSVKVSGESYFNEDLLLSEMNTESLNYYQSKPDDDSLETSTEARSSGIVREYTLTPGSDHIADLGEIEETILKSSDLVVNGKPINEHHQGSSETVLDWSDKKIEESIQHSDLKKHNSIDNIQSYQRKDFDDVKNKGRSDLSNNIVSNPVEKILHDKNVEFTGVKLGSNIEVFSKHSYNDDADSSSNKKDKYAPINDEVFSKHRFDDKSVDSTYDKKEEFAPINDEGIIKDGVFSMYSSNREVVDTISNYSTNQASEGSYESYKSVEQVMRSDDFIRSQKNKKQVQTNHSINDNVSSYSNDQSFNASESNYSTTQAPKESVLSNENVKQVIKSEEFIESQQNEGDVQSNDTTIDNMSSYSNDQVSNVSEFNYKNVAQLMMSDELMKSQQDKNGGQSNHVNNAPPKASELSSRNMQRVMMNDAFISNQQIEQLQSQKVEQGGNNEPCPGCDLGLLPVTTSAGNKGKIENSPFRQSHAIPEASIQFAEVPPEKDLRVDDMGLAEGSFLFGYLGELLSWLQPNDFPVELMRNALRNQISIIDLITQSLKLEAGFIGCIAIGVSLALAAPIVVLAHTCYRIRRKGDDGDQTPIGCAGNCRRRTLVFFLQIIIFLLLIGTAAMLITNQQVSTAVLQTSDVLKTVLDDLGTFLHNVHHQLHFVVSKHLDQAVQAVNSDLDNVEILLGQPIQTELSRETGLDVALESLRDIAQDVSKVGESVELVQLAAGLLSEGVIMTTDKLSDLRLQVNSFRRQCSPKDRPLCDTLNIAGLEVTLRVDSLRQDDKLNRVRQIGGPELRGAVESARVLFRDIPRQVAVDTKDSREGVRRQLNQEQMNIDESIRSLEILVRNLKGKLTTGQNVLDDIAVDIPELEFWRWMIGLGAAGSLALLWILLQLGISCGCCGSEKSAGPTLLICVILICLLSTVLWLLAIIVFVIGGHGQAFICRPLYQGPEFPALSQLLDNPGLFPNSHKFISTLAFDNDTIDVPFNKVLRECHENKPVYPVFKLNGVFNVETMTESKKWDKFRDKLDDIKVKLNHLKVLSPTLQNQLNDLLQALSVNLTAHRNYLSSPVTGKDLNSFAAQLESVGNQIKDLATASRMETLASRTRRLIATHIEPLKEKKNNLLYQLTTLEVQLNPLQRQVEQSISHFKTIQFFIDNQGNSIANKKVKEYTHRLMRYIDQYKNNLADRINNNLARCQPLWKLFNISRLMLCKHVMDPLNGFWFSTVCCLIILLCATPVCLKLVDCYKKKSQAANYNSGSPTENLMSNEHGRDWSSSNGTNDSGGGW